jgi:hypothetical protein
VINTGEFGDEDEIRWRKENYPDISHSSFETSGNLIIIAYKIYRFVKMVY